MIRTFLLILMPCVLSCSCQNTNQPIASTKLNSRQKNIIPYPTFLKEVNTKRKQLKNSDWKTINNYLLTLLNNDIPAYWIGTKWDFNGVSSVPKEGTIACGYFVTNTLSDLGFRIQRVRLAQQASSLMIKTICVNTKTISGLSQLETYLNRQSANTIFIVGLDFHTGYILKTDSECYFLHSNYINKQGVVKEKIADSKALAQSKVFVLGNLSINRSLLKKWVQ